MASFAEEKEKNFDRRQNTKLPSLKIKCNGRIFSLTEEHRKPEIRSAESIVTGSEEAGSPSDSQVLVLVKGVCVSCNPIVRQPILNICS